MKNFTKLLALVLSLLMILSVVIALPASAAEATSAKKVLWAHDFTQVTAEEAANKNYYTDNEVFGNYTYGWDGATTSGIEIYDSSSSMAYANGLIGMRTGDTIFRTTTDSPSKGTDVGNNDFYKLLNGFYSDSSYTQKVKGNKVFFEFDFVWFKLPTQESIHSANGGYMDTNGETVSATLYSDYAGDSQKGRLLIMYGGHGNLDPLIYLGGNGLDKGYVYAESNMTTSGYTTVPTDDSVYYMNGTEKVYLPAGTELTGTVSTAGAKFLPKDPSAAYEIDYKTRYRFGIEVEITSIASNGQVEMKATVYIKHADAENWEACVGSTNYYSRPYDGSYTGTLNCKAEQEKIVLGYSGSTGYKKLGGDMEIYTYSCNGTDHLNVVENKSGTDVSCTCIDCGKTWTEREVDGIRYIGETVGNACEGSYTLWTPVNGVGSPFVDSYVAGQHSYDTSGKCTACGKYEYIGWTVETAPSFAVSTTSNTSITPSEPSYNSQSGKVEAPTGGTVTVTTNMASGNDYSALYAPITVSFDLTVNDVLLNDTSKIVPFPLLNFVGNNSGSTTEELLALGALEENADTVEVMFFQMNDRASSGTYGWAGCVEKSSIYTLKLGETYSFFLLVDPVTLRESVYINGEYVGSAVLDKIATSLTQEYQFRFGQNTINAPYFFNYSLDNIDATLHSTIKEAYAAIPTNQLFSLRYDRWQTGHTVSSSRPALFQGVTPYFGGGENLLPSSYNEGDDGSVYATMSESGAERKISLSTTSGDTRFDLSGKKYEIRVNFALDSTTTLASGSNNLVNVYRSTDTSVRWALVSYATDGTYLAHNGGLYDKDGNTLTFMRTVTNGVPESTSDLRVIVDEANGTYSIYVDGDIAYFRNGNRFDPFLNRPLADAKTFTDDKDRTCDYLQLFQGKIPAILKEASITLIPDSDIEFIGSQSRNSDHGAASGTFDLRFVFGVDDLYMSAAGFRVTAYKNGEQVGEEQNVALSAVYSTLNSNGGKLHAYACPEGQYLAAFKIVGIEETNSEDTYLFEITPYANGVDGETYEIECDGLGQIKKH